jgi:hypothetical protein
MLKLPHHDDRLWGKVKIDLQGLAYNGIRQREEIYNTLAALISETQPQLTLGQGVSLASLEAAEHALGTERFIKTVTHIA